MNNKLHSTHQQSNPPAPAERLQVLVVDDDPAMCNSLRRVLQLDGYDVQTAGSSREMLARQDLHDFFAILLDRRLPDGDAGDAVEGLRRVAVNAAILIITGHADMNSTLAAIRQGVDDYLIKPVEPDALRARLNSLAELHRVRQELRASEARMRFMVEHLPAGAVYVDREKLFMNQAVVAMTGYSMQEIGTVSDWFSVLCHDNANLCREKYNTARTEGFPAPCQLPIRRSDGVGRELEIAGYSYDHHEVWLVTDVTQLRDTQQRLVQAERLAAIGQMVTGLAHESRNALQRARGCLDLLELDLEEQTEQLDLINRIRRSLGDLQRNYEEVRIYAAPIVLQKEPVATADLVQSAFDDLQCEFGHSAHTLHFDEPTPGLQPNSEAPTQNMLDKHRVTQVFRNILENAMAASPPGSAITVQIRQCPAEAASPPRERITITDQGSGMSPETKTRIFEPFYTTKHSGTGLGMAICRRIIDAHAGHIWASGSTGQGTTVGIEIPLTPPPHRE